MLNHPAVPRVLSFGIFIGLVALQSVVSCGLSSGQTSPKPIDLSPLIERIRKNPSDMDAMQQLVKLSPDLRAVSALRGAFDDARVKGLVEASGSIKWRISQLIAVQLVKLGIADDAAYFDHLVRYAREAMAAAPPNHMFRRDENGVENKDRGLDPAFANWCAKRGLGPGACLHATSEYAMDINLLVSTHDRRTIPVFREVLKTTSKTMMTMAIYGLADLDDIDSIPLVAEACSRLPPEDAKSLGLSATAFRHPSAQILFDVCISNPEIRAQTKKEWLEKQAGPSASPNK